MKQPFFIGVTGGLLGIGTAIYVIFSANSPDMIFSGVQAALFSSLGLMGAALASRETRFAGWMLLASAACIIFSVPLGGTVYLLYWYIPTIVILGYAAALCFLAPNDEDTVPTEGTDN
ncbi:MAG: hypothetical protein ABFC78_01520 [Methanoregula sp.]